RAEGGCLSVSSPNVPPRKGYPLSEQKTRNKDTLTGSLDAILDGVPCTPARARADSDSVSVSSSKETTTTEESVLLESQVAGLQALYEAGGVPFSQRDSIDGVQAFISRPVLQRANVCEYVA